MDAQARLRRGAPNPYRIIWDFMRTVDASEAIVTHDSGGPRDQLMPFYRATAPQLHRVGQIPRPGDRPGADHRGQAGGAEMGSA